MGIGNSDHAPLDGRTRGEDQSQLQFWVGFSSDGLGFGCDTLIRGKPGKFSKLIAGDGQQNGRTQIPVRYGFLLPTVRTRTFLTVASTDDSCSRNDEDLFRL